MSAADRWATKHGYCDEPARLAVINEIVARFDEGSLLLYVYCWDWVVAPTFEVPMPVAIRLDCSHKTEWVLNGLYPTECDRLRSHVPDDGGVYGTTAKQEMCVVATLATLLHLQGISLDERTVLYLHGHPVVFGDRQLIPSPPAPIRLCEHVDNYEWDEVADFLAEQQKELQHLATGRRGRGRPEERGIRQVGIRAI